MRESATSNIPLSFLPDLMEYAAALDLNDIATVVFGYPYYAPELNYRNLPIVDPERIQAKVRSALTAVETVAGAADLLRRLRRAARPAERRGSAAAGRPGAAAGAPTTTTTCGRATAPVRACSALSRASSMRASCRGRKTRGQARSMRPVRVPFDGVAQGAPARGLGHRAIRGCR